MEVYAGKKIYAKNLSKEAASALSLGKEKPEVTRELYPGSREHATAKHDDGAESYQSG